MVIQQVPPTLSSFFPILQLFTLKSTGKLERENKNVMLMVLCFRPGEISLKKGCYRLFFVCLFINLFI